MSATYEPGAVAVATVRGVPNVRVMYTAARVTHWLSARPVHDTQVHWLRHITDVRPLVVIDPDDREQVERLARTTHVALTGDVPSWPTLSGKDQVRRMDALTMALHAEIDAVRVIFEGVTA